MRKAKPYRGWADIQPLNDNATNEKIKPYGLLEQGQVRVKDVLVLPSHENLDDGLVTSIAESFPFSGGGPFNPIIVRRVRELENGEEVIKTVLVAGAQRLQAVRLTGIEYVNCVYIEGDETEARLVQIAEDLFRKDLTVLRRADMLAEWLAVALLNFSGQVVRKGQGRSLAGLARAAGVLPAIGRSVEARRKTIDRAVLIARLPPEVKKAVKKAHLDNNQRALLKIAKVKGRKAQLAKVEDLAGRPEKSSVLPIQTGKAATSTRNGLQGNTNGAVQRPPLQSGTGGVIGGNKSATVNKTATTPVKRETTFDDLEAFWNPDGRELWAYAPFSEREQFIEKLRRAKCKAQVDVVAFLRDVFRGRFEVRKRDLYALAKTKGLAKAAVQKALRDLSYPAKRKGQRSWAVWYFRNKDRNWENQVRTVSDAELNDASATHSNPVLKKSVKGSDRADRKKSRAEYYGNL